MCDVRYHGTWLVLLVITHERAHGNTLQGHAFPPNWRLQCAIRYGAEVCSS